MKKNFKMIFAAAAAFAMVLSCSKEENPSQGTQGAGSADSLTPITISATLADNMTKVSFTPSYDGGKPQSLALAWEAEDKLRVYNHDDRTQFADFEIAEESIGQKTGSFTGEIFTAASYDVEVINGEVGYAEQTQPADGETASLKYLASATGVTDLKAVVFTESSSVLAITALMPEGGAAGVTSVELSASEAIFSTGKTLTINLVQKGDSGDDGILHLFATLPVGNQQIAEGTTLLVRFNAPDTDHTVYTRYVELGAQTLEAGKLNTINVNASQSDKHAGLVSCDGSTAEKAYLIADKYQLQAMATLASTENQKYFELIDDINLDGLNWTSVNGKVNFEGNGWTISKLNAPLFDDLGGNVSDLILSAATIESTTTAGVLAKTANTTAVSVTGVTISDSSLKSTASETDNYAGALVGEVASASSFDNCHIIGSTISATTNKPYVGGAFGYIHNPDAKVGSVTKCTIDNKTIRSGGDNVGGFVSVIDGGSINNCEVACAVSGGSLVGGFVGVIRNGSLSGNSFTGTHTCTYQTAGGFAGQMQAGSVTGCLATSGVTYTKSATYAYVGGFIGNLSGGELTRCSATGIVTVAGGAYSGGFIGYMSNGSITESYSSVNVSSNAGNYLGGMVGWFASGTATISNSFVSGSIQCGGSYAGFFGGGDAKAYITITNCYINAQITGAKWNACVFAGSIPTNCTYSGFVGWNVSNRVNWANNLGSCPENNYMGTSGTISAKAREYGWDETIWDLNGADPKLKWTLPSNN